MVVVEPRKVILLAADTTAGLRRDTAQITDALDQLGVDHTVVTSTYQWTRHLRRGYPFDDLAHSLSLRLALRSADDDGAVVLCGTTMAALLLPSRVLERSGVRFDALAHENRPGWRSAITRALERRWLRKVRVAFPYTEASELQCRRLGPSKPVVHRLEPYVFERHQHSDAKRRGVLTYASNPFKKGLDIAVMAFSASDVDEELFVAGIDEGEARSFLSVQGVAVPSRVRFLGVLSPGDYRTASRRARVYLGSSRVDEFATTQFEALADGALLVTCPSAGVNAPYEIARRLDDGLVAPDLTPGALATALCRAFAYDNRMTKTYRVTAAAAVDHLSADRFRQRVAEVVLPALFEPAEPTVFSRLVAE